MGGGAGFAAEGYSLQLEFERLDRELDAALGFAAAAEHTLQNGNAEFGAVCLSDVPDGYASAGRSAQYQPDRRTTTNLNGKLIRLRRLLGARRVSGSEERNETA